jgi:hypothetical protein
MNGNTVFCKGDLITQAYVSYTVDLQPHAVAIARPTLLRTTT